MRILAPFPSAYKQIVLTGEGKTQQVISSDLFDVHPYEDQHQLGIVQGYVYVVTPEFLAGEYQPLEEKRTALTVAATASQTVLQASTLGPDGMSADGFPASGYLCVGNRSSSAFEVVQYTSITSGQFNLASGLANAHPIGEPVVYVEEFSPNGNPLQTLVISADGVRNAGT